ncbi:sodium:proton antiporter [Mucilaginibacter sp. CAU 1740]|uniref:cation:proton antiporter n=1 Tax=Mucilaginibacter sp. CAU 1740 TaxID=3140365 RepID=UPI00325BB9A9
MQLFVLIALLVIVSAIYSYINARFVKLPGTIGIITIAIIGSVLTVIADKLDPDVGKRLMVIAKDINFSSLVLNILLGFLLFAGSFNANTKRLKKEMRPVVILSTLSVLLSAGIFGALFHFIGEWLHIRVPLIYCFLFGALISPTDPVSVGNIIKNSKLPVILSTIIAGESLFNDGVGLVLFITILEAIRSGTDNVDLAKTALLFLREVFGGIALGVILGIIGHWLMKTITDFQTIVLVSLSLVMSISLIGAYFELSIPLAAVSAGLFVGDNTINIDDKERSHEALEKFWQLVDEMLNTILFVMIGLQMVNLPYLTNYWLTGTLSIVLILVARWLSIFLPLIFLRRSLNVNYSNIHILTWAGVRGGISIALALSLPASHYRHIILSACYFVVIFSIVVQGLSLNRVIRAGLKHDQP